MNYGFCTYDYEKENNTFYMLRDCNNNQVLVFQFSYGDNCVLCSTEMDANKGRFQSPPAWLFFSVNYTRHDQKVNCLDLPKIIKVQDLSFKLICCSIVVNGKTSASHFKGIFLIEDQFHMLEDLTPTSKRIMKISLLLLIILIFSRIILMRLIRNTCNLDKG